MSETFITEDNSILSEDKKTLIRAPERFIQSKSGKEACYKIPDHVVILADKAFKDCKNLTEIIIPEGITHIGNDCFFNCQNLRKIELPNSLEHIGTGAFSFCKKLEKIVIPAGICKIPSLCFKQCNSLKEILLPQSVAVIEDFAFVMCKSLTTIMFYPEQPGTIDVAGNAFAFCPYGKVKRNFFITLLVVPISILLNLAGYALWLFGIINLADILLRLCTDSYRMKYNADMTFGQVCGLLAAAAVVTIIAELWKRLWKL